MYIPAAHNQPDRNAIFDMIQRYSFGLLVSSTGGEPFATHLPLLLDRNAGPNGSIVGHLARANPQWQHAEGQSVLAIFPGPHTYISPTWYQSENVVPTWNYVAVHVYGIFRAIQDEQELLKIVHDTVRTYEGSMPAPWQTDIQSDFNKKLAKAIVGFRIEITRMEGKLKLSQNHPEERRKKVIAALQHSPDQDAREIAALMATAELALRK